MVSLFIPRLFPGYTVSGKGAFRVIRDSDIEIEEEAEDLVRFFETRAEAAPPRLGDPPRDRARTCRRRCASSCSARSTCPTPSVHIIPGMLGIDHLSQLVGLDRPDLKFEPYTPRFPERIREHGGDCFAAIRQKDIIVHHPYESFDVVRAVPAPGGVRPRRRGDQADALPHLQRFPDRQGADRGGRGRQVGDRAGRAEGPLRRGGEHPLGARPGAGRGAGRLRLHRAEDARQAVAGRAARGRRARELRPCRHRQLPPDHGAHLHRPQLLHRRSGDRPRRGAHLQLHHRLCAAAGAEAHRGLAAHAPPAHPRAHRRGDRACPGRPAGRRSG